MKVIPLIIEKGNDSEIWGRIDFEKELIVDFANSVEELEKKMKNLLLDFFEISSDKIKFRLEYDLTVLFNHKNYLNISAIASKAGINASLMRQYATGKKFPSEERAKKIEGLINEIGKDLLSVKISTKKINKTRTTKKELISKRKNSKSKRPA